MEGTTFDLTAPITISQPPKLIKNETVVLNIKKEPTVETKRTVPTKLPVVKNQSESSKSLQKLTKIEVFREALDKAMTTQPAQNKKDKKIKPTSDQQKVQLDAIQDAYEQKVTHHYHEVYKHYKDKSKVVTDELKNLEKKQNIQKQIEKKEDYINKEKSQHDALLYEIKQKITKIKKLDDLIQNMPVVEVDNTQETVEEKLKEEQDAEEKLKQLGHELAILRGMHDSRKRLLIQVQEQCKDCYDSLEIETQKTKINANNKSYREKNLESLSKMVQRYRSEQLNQQPIFGSALKQRFDPMLEEKLEEELSQFEDLRALKQVIQHEKEIKQEYLKEEKQKKVILHQQQLKQQEDATKQIRIDKERIEQILRARQTLFEQLRRVTSIADLEKIIPHKEDLDLGLTAMKKLEELVSADIEKLEDQNMQLLQKIKILKYEEKESIEQEGLINLDELERKMVREYDLLAEKEKQVKKVEKSIDEVTMSLSRIMYQLQGKGSKPKNVEIQKKQLVGISSHIQLRLERMLTVLSKTQEFLNEESVNTNPKYTRVHEFLGINQRRYADMDQLDYIESDQFQYKEDESLDPDEYDLEQDRKLFKDEFQKMREEQQKLKEKPPPGTQKKKN